MTTTHGLFILSGYNIRAVIAFCRFARANRLPIHLLAKSETDPIFMTTYRRFVCGVRHDQQLEPDYLLSVLNAIRKKHNYEGMFVVPTTEYFNRFIFSCREELEYEGHIIPLANQNYYEMVSDKYKFRTLCNEYGLQVPKEYNIMPATVPFVAKPRQYLSRGGQPLKPIIFLEHNDPRGGSATIVDPRDYYFQEYVGGESHYLLAHISKSGDATICSQQNLMQQQGGGSMILARDSRLHETNIAQRYIDMLREIGFHGLIMIELKKMGNRFLMIEANPRPWGPLQFTLDAKHPILAAYMRDYGYSIRDPIVRQRAPTYYFWSGGMSAEGTPFVFHNYSPEHFIVDYTLFRANDIFLRPDTKQLYYHESKNGNNEHIEP